MVAIELIMKFTRITVSRIQFSTFRSFFITFNEQQSKRIDVANKRKKKQQQREKNYNNKT